MTSRVSRPAASGPLPAALLVAVLLLAGCGGGPAATPAEGERAGASQSAQGPEEAPVDQTTPGAAARSYFRAVHEGRFADACRLLAPVVQARYASAGQDCRTEMAGLFDEPTRAAIGGQVEADESLVRVVGDTAAIPASALSRVDLKDGEPAPSFPDMRATRQNGSWYLLP